MQTRPKRGQGERFLECRYYNDCLDLAALRNWKTFNCESCDLYKTIGGISKRTPMLTIPEKPKNTRTCEECGKNTTIQPNSPLCASCIGKRPKKNRDRSKIKKGKGGKGKMAREEKSQQQGNTALTIEFGKHAQILKEIEKLAEEEIRSTDEQIIYILKNYLSNTQEAKRN